MKKFAIIVAGGSGSRMKSDVPKQFLLLGGKPVLYHTLKAFATVEDVSILLVLPETQISAWEKIVEKYKIAYPHQIVTGGSSRFHSVKNGLAEIENSHGLIAVHDGVRPLITPSLISHCYEEASVFGSAITTLPLKDSIRKIQRDGSSIQVDREGFRMVQTPQVFRADMMKKAFDTDYHPHFTDCASVVEHAGFHVHLVEGDYKNIKITTPEDLAVAEALLRG